MIPQAYIQAWREHAPWPNPAQVEQDLIICRALCDLFNAPPLADKIAFRGGTAIHKLLFKRPLRYSEDIEPLLPVGVRFDEAVTIEAFNDVWSTLIARLCGDAWRLSADVVAQLRTKYPRLLT